jgi:DNA-binding NtrC family response regulator
MDTLDILIVDDDPVNLTILQKRLVEMDHTVETVPKGEDAIKRVDQRAFDVVISDLMMPQVDGIAVLEAIKKRRQHTEVLLMTAYATVDSAVEAMKKGAMDYLQKPINFGELELKLQRIALVKSLSKNANDLHEAMKVTEENAALTIQTLEKMIIQSKDICADIRNTLQDETLSAEDRIHRTLQRLEEIV